METETNDWYFIFGWLHQRYSLHAKLSFFQICYFQEVSSRNKLVT